jgi:hypothetical protein
LNQDSTQVLEARVRRRLDETVPAIVVLHLANRETIETTPRQRLMTGRRGLIKAADLKAGDLLRTVKKDLVKIESVVLRNEPTLVYALELERGAHYYVGDIGVQTSVIKDAQARESKGTNPGRSRSGRPKIGPEDPHTA